MPLQNALEDLATDSRLAELIAEVVSQTMNQAPRALQYARTPTDQMRVSVDTGTIVANTIQWLNANTYNGWYATGAPNSMDAREQQREMSQQTFNQVRTDRWVIT